MWMVDYITLHYPKKELIFSSRETSVTSPSSIHLASFFLPKKQTMCFFSVVLSKQVFHIISAEPISERSTSKSFHESSVQLVRGDVIGTLWRAKTRKLYDKTPIKYQPKMNNVVLNIYFNCIKNSFLPWKSSMRDTEGVLRWRNLAMLI